MKRREFVGLLGAAATWPLSARAQQSERVARIGYISFVSAARSRRNDDEFRAGLRDLGYVEGRNIISNSAWLAVIPPCYHGWRQSWSACRLM